MTKVLFSGCSYTSGAGLDLGSQNPLHYTNVLSKEIFGDSVSIHNIGVDGYSNLRIFLDTCMALSTTHYDCAFVGWTSYPRYYLHIGLEEYECRRMFMPNDSPMIAHNGNDLIFSAKFLNTLRDNLMLISNAHYDILDIVRYVNILKSLAESKNVKIYFLNNICHWDHGYFTQVQSSITPCQLTDYTKKILNTNNRDDSEIEILYKKIHNDYRSCGSIQELSWLNLYDSMSSFISKFDVGNDNIHPGPLTHQYYGKFLAKKLQSI